MRWKPRSDAGAGRGGRKSWVGSGGKFVAGPPPVPGPVPVPVPVPMPDPTPPPEPGPAPGPPVVPDPVPVPPSPDWGAVDGEEGAGAGAGGTGCGVTTGFGGSIGAGATSAAASGLGLLSWMKRSRSPAGTSSPPALPPPPPPAGPSPPAPRAGSPTKFDCAAGYRMRRTISACAKREAATPFHRPSLLLGNPTGGLSRPFIAARPQVIPSVTCRSPSRRIRAKRPSRR